MSKTLRTEPDFGGYATRYGVLCSDGRTIKDPAFQHQDGEVVPLMWQHQHNSPSNVLGHAVLEHREDGVYAYAYFNGTTSGKEASQMVKHKDVRALSIYANRLTEHNKNVVHGNIREVSLVLAGANPQAYIEDVSMAHSENGQFEAIISTMDELELNVISHADEDGDEKETKEADKAEESEKADPTVQEVLETLNEDQQAAVAYLLGEALDVKGVPDDEEEESDEDDDSETEAKHSEDNQQSSEEDALTHTEEGTEMHRNQFKSGNVVTTNGELKHADVAKDIFSSLKSTESLREVVEEYALSHGINDIDQLFPDAQAVNGNVELLARRNDWVTKVLAGVTKRPFSKIKSFYADLTHEDARAQGYIKGSLKREEYFTVARRVTEPQTIYKVQKLDRDDILDITDFDVLAFLKAEMRIMLDEEIARAILIGDGRSNADELKIKEDKIRPIASDHELYVTTVNVNIDDEGSSAEEIIDALTANRHHYRGSGNPTLFISDEALGKLLLAKDGIGRRLYNSLAEVATAARASEVVPVEAFNQHADLVGILVDLRDYAVGANKGGEVSFFEDFDLNYNKQEYLIEARPSGALVKPKAAIVVRKVAGTAVLVVPTAPTFAANKVTIPTDANVVYKNKSTGATMAAGDTTLTSGQSLTVVATPAAGKYFENNVNDEWTFKFKA